MILMFLIGFDIRIKGNSLYNRERLVLKKNDNGYIFEVFRYVENIV